MSETASDKVPNQLSFGKAARFWLKLGCISFGGPAGQIALMHRELVDRRRWISETRFLHALNYCFVLPGPEAQQLATYIGWLFHGVPGGIVAGGLFILPSLALMILLGGLYVAFGDQPLIAAALGGAKLAVVAIVISALIKLTRRSLSGRLTWLIAGSSFIALSWWQLPFPVIIILAGVVGLLAQRFGNPIQIASPQLALDSQVPHGRADVACLHDDRSPLPDHASLSAGKALCLSLAAVLLWALPLTGLIVWQGTKGTFTEMALFFSVAALVTFGGAYAVLPYVAERAVDHSRWLTANQMIDGLALGETTPGPLIMIVAFVGYLGGFQTTDLGIAGGVLGAIVATWYTFLPSFFLIFLGAPVIEKSRGMVQLSSVLGGISAAVVGVVAQLAVRFAETTFWPVKEKMSFEDWLSSADWIGIAFALLALVLLVRYKLNIFSVIGGAVAFGLARVWLRAA